MAYSSTHQAYVYEAIRRWRAKGLIDATLAARLSAEAAAASREEQQRQGEHALAAVGAAVLGIALIVFFAWAWPSLAEGARLAVLLGSGVLVFGAGTMVLDHTRWMAVGQGLHALGTLLLLGGFAYSEELWARASMPAQAIGLASVLTPLALARLGLSRHPNTSALATGVFFAFLYVGLSRATTWEPDTIIWTLDAALLALFAWLWLRTERLGRPLDPREVAVLTTALFAGFLFAALTAMGPLGMDRWAVLPVDAWLALLLALGFAGLAHDAPPVPHEWLTGIVAAGALLALPLAFWTLAGAAELPYAATSALIAALGGVWLTLAMQAALPQLLPPGALTLLAAAWYFAIRAGGALLAAVALALTAGVMFWTSTRMRAQT